MERPRRCRRGFLGGRARALVPAAVLVVAGLAMSGGAQAQALSRLAPGQQAVTLETGLESGVVTTVGYAAGVRVGGLDRTVMPFVQAGLVSARPDLHDYAARAGAQVSLVDFGWIDLSTQLAVGLDATENSIHRAHALKTDLVLLAGHYAPRWFVAAEAGYDRAWLTYIKNSDWYRTYFYAGARDGWYHGTAGTLHGGLRGGLRLGRVELVLRAGLNRTETLQELALPFYATVGASWRF